MESNRDIEDKPARDAAVIERELPADQLIENEQHADEQRIYERNIDINTPEINSDIIDRNWCRVDISNILPNRTRSKVT